MEVIKILQIPPIYREPFDIKRIMELTSSIGFFKKLTEDQNSSEAHMSCCNAMELLTLQSNQFVFEYGAYGDTFYIILSGQVGIQIPTKRKVMMPKQDNHSLLPSKEMEEVEVMEMIEVATLSDGASFGELALINDKPRAASVICKTECHFAVLRKNDYDSILGQIQAKVLDGKIVFFKNLPYFKDWTRFSLHKLSFYFNQQNFRRGQVVYNEGDAMDFVYFVRQGEFKMSERQSNEDNKPQKVYFRLKSRRQMSINSQLKNKEKVQNLPIVIKTTNEVFGYEEILNKRNKRIFTCECISSLAQVYVISKEVTDIKDFRMRILNNPDTSRKLRVKYENDTK